MIYTTETGILLHRLTKTVLESNGVVITKFGENHRIDDVYLCDVRKKGFVGGRNENSPFDIGVIFKGKMVGQYKTLKSAIIKANKICEIKK